MTISGSNWRDEQDQMAARMASEEFRNTMLAFLGGRPTANADRHPADHPILSLDLIRQRLSHMAIYVANHVPHPECRVIINEIRILDELIASEKIRGAVVVHLPDMTDLDGARICVERMPCKSGGAGPGPCSP